MSFDPSTFKELTAYAEKAEDTANRFLARYLVLQEVILNGKLGKHYNLTSNDRERFPMLNYNYCYTGITATHAVFQSSYDYESTSFAQFALADVMTDAADTFFERMKTAYGVGDNPAETAEIQQLLALQAKYPHINPRPA